MQCACGLTFDGVEHGYARMGARKDCCVYGISTTLRSRMQCDPCPNSKRYKVHEIESEEDSESCDSNPSSVAILRLSSTER